MVEGKCRRKSNRMALIEETHGITDNSLCQLLKELGFKKLVEEYEKVPKYYA